MRLIHIIDIMAGLTLMIYGFLVSAQPNSPPGAITILVLCGFLLTFTSGMGVLGFMTGWCKRCGLAISAYGGPIIAIVEVVFTICIAATKDSFFNYLRDNREALLMSEQTIRNLEKIIPVLFIIALLCSAVEVIRFSMLRTVRENMLRYDDQRQKAFASRRRSPRIGLEEPLLPELSETTGQKNNKNSTPSTKDGNESEGDLSLDLDPVDETISTEELWWTQAEREEEKTSADLKWAGDASV